MPKKKTSRKKIPVKTDVASVEKETIKRVGRAISVIENFLAKWDSSFAKPGSMLPQITRIKRFHDALVKWQREAMRSQGDEEKSLRRLHDFVTICHTYS
jgi:hypothetical protein